MRRTGSRKVKIAFSAGKLTHFGGVYLLHQFLQQLHFRTFIGRRITIAERNNRFTVSERLFALMYPMILGLSSIELTTLLGTNGVFQYLTGLPSFPNPTTLRRFLIEKAEILLPQLRSVHNDLRFKFLSLTSESGSFCFDFDSTARTLYGHQEGVVVDYNPGKRGRDHTIPSSAPRQRLAYVKAACSASVMRILQKELPICRAMCSPQYQKQRTRYAYVPMLVFT